MKYGSYAVLQYIVPSIAYVIPFIITLIVALLQCCFISCENTKKEGHGDRLSFSKRFFILHMRSARVLLGKVVRLRKKDHAVVLHGFPFRGVLPMVYIFLSECLIAGTISAFTISTLIFQDSHSCDVSKQHLDCFFTNVSSWNTDPIDCSDYLENSSQLNELICYQVTVNIGAALGVVGGLISLSPVVFSVITRIILYFAKSEVYIRVLLVIAQILVYIIGASVIAVLAAFYTDLIKSNVGIQISVAILLSITLFCMPWCVLETGEGDTDIIYVGDDLFVQSGDSYVYVPNETTPIVNNDRRKRRHKY